MLLLLLLLLRLLLPLFKCKRSRQVHWYSSLSLFIAAFDLLLFLMLPVMSFSMLLLLLMLFGEEESITLRCPTDIQLAETNFSPFLLGFGSEFLGWIFYWILVAFQLIFNSNSTWVSVKSNTMFKSFDNSTSILIRSRPLSTQIDFTNAN